MGRNIFERIADMINGTVNKETNESVSVENISPNDNSINKQGKLLTAIIAVLKSNYGGQQVSFNDKSLAIWVGDNLFYNSIIESDFKSELITSLNVELGFSFGTIEIKSDNIPESVSLTEVLPSIFLQILPINPVQIVKTAKLHAIEGNGSTLDAVYILDSQEIQKMPNKRYNIGIGKKVVLSGMCRENHIVIDDNIESNQFEKNKYVSRSHAYISYFDEYGFMLNVETSGTRMAGKRTRILRDNTVIELNNEKLPEQLQDNDIIELSKAVLLLFEQL